MCGIAGAGKAGRIAGAAAAAAMVATRRSLPRAAVDERSLANEKKVPPSQKAKSDGELSGARVGSRPIVEQLNDRPSE